MRREQPSSPILERRRHPGHRRDHRDEEHRTHRRAADARALDPVQQRRKRELSEAALGMALGVAARVPGAFDQSDLVALMHLAMGEPLAR